MARKKTFTGLGGLLLFLGILTGFFICSLIVWGDLEATLFTDGINGDSRIGSLHCPVLITPNETGTIFVNIKNPSDYDSNRFLRASISEGFANLIRESKEIVPIPANSKVKVEWKIYPEDAVFNRIVFFRLFVPSKYPYPSMSGRCGVIKLDIPWLSGKQILAVSSLAGLLLFISGTMLFEHGIHMNANSLSPKIRIRINGVYTLAGILVISAVISYFGFWVLGLFGLVASIILVVLLILRR